MKVIYKYTLDTVDQQKILVKKGAEIMHVDVQHDQVCFWAMVDDGAQEVYRGFAVHGTGHYVVIQATIENYLGTVALQGGSFILHVFDMGEECP